MKTYLIQTPFGRFISRHKNITTAKKSLPKAERKTATFTEVKAATSSGGPASTPSTGAIDYSSYEQQKAYGIRDGTSRGGLDVYNPKYPLAGVFRTPGGYESRDLTGKVLSTAVIDANTATIYGGAQYDTGRPTSYSAATDPYYYWYTRTYYETRAR
jgi:hypothetical protein